MKKRGHPFIGAIAGFIFFLSAILLLLTTGTIDFGSPLVMYLPLAGLLVGIVVALVAPFGKAEELQEPAPEV